MAKNGGDHLLDKDDLDHFKTLEQIFT